MRATARSRGDEYLGALEHYIDGVITKAEYLDVLELYLG